MQSRLFVNFSTHQNFLLYSSPLLWYSVIELSGKFATVAYLVKILQYLGAYLS